MAAPGQSGQGEASGFICVTCGTRYPPSAEPPPHCPICEDDRQYLPAGGQEWTTRKELRGRHHNRFETMEPGVTRIASEPRLGIGQEATLIETDQGNILWETIAFLDEATVAEIERRGGVRAIAISHPHFYTTMGEWSRALGDVPIYLHADNGPWVMNPTPAIRYFDGETREVLPGVTIVRCGGHFPGSSVLHWAGGANGAGLLFSGDTMQVAMDRRWVSFMYSYPNLIPLDAASVERIVAAVEPYPFARLYGSFPGGVVAADAKGAVRRSAHRYIAHLQGSDLG